MRGRLLLAAALAAGTSVVFSGGDASASSHREAPFVTKNPKVDSTDFYMFRSYEAGRDGYVTMVANYLPLQDSYGGPNYFSLDPEALYEIHIDNNGDGTEDLTFQFQFQNALNGPNGLALPITLEGETKTNAVPLMNIGGITAADTSKLHVLETYSLKLVKGDRRTGAITELSHSGGKVFKKPADFIGTTTYGSIANYDTYAKAHIFDFDIPGCANKGRAFAGQRREGFAANIGIIFDLIQSPNIAGAITGGSTAAGRGRNNNNPEDTGLLYNKNVTSLALEVPIECVRASADKPIIGAWTTASMRQARVLNPNATYAAPTKEGGAWTQVSRLGMPLVNEVVIGIKDKDKFGASHPKGDAQFADYVTHPTLPALIEVLYGAQGAVAPKKKRADLVAVFAQGVPSVNQNTTTGVFEYTRLNTSLAPTAKGQQNSLGALQCFVDGALTLNNPGCDPAGFPNGRRPGDDTVDIALRVVMGALFANDTDAPARGVPFTDLNYNADEQFDATFPYLRTPHPGNNNPYNPAPQN